MACRTWPATSSRVTTACCSRLGRSEVSAQAARALRTRGGGAVGGGCCERYARTSTSSTRAPRCWSSRQAGGHAHHSWTRREARSGCPRAPRGRSAASGSGWCIGSIPARHQRLPWPSLATRIRTGLSTRRSRRGGWASATWRWCRAWSRSPWARSTGPSCRRGAARCVRWRRAKKGKASRTLYKVRERFTRFTWLELEPQSGRQHQLRVHLSSIGHPLAVDDRPYSGSGAAHRPRPRGRQR